MPEDYMRLIYVSPVPLSSFAQRPHHFVEWFHRQHDAEVLWVEPGPSRLPRLSDSRRLVRALSSAGPDLSPPWSREPWLHHLRCRVAPLEPLNWGRLLNQQLWRPVLKAIDEFVTPDTRIVLGKPCALSLELARRYRGLGVVFDVMDHLSDFFEGRSRRWMRHAETRLADEVRWIMASSTALTHNLAAHHAKLRTVLNGLTPPTLHPALQADPPSPPPQPVFGYVGTIDHWFDWEAVAQLAEENPHARVDLVGPCGHWPDLELPENVRLLPPIPQHQVHEVLCGFSLGLIPFRLCRLTQYVDPVKYYEYRAAGLPVLSSRFGEMAHRGPRDGVFFFDDLWSEHTAIGQVLASRPDEQQTREFVAHNAWDRRFEAVEFLSGSQASISASEGYAAGRAEPPHHVPVQTALPARTLVSSPPAAAITFSEPASASASRHWDDWQRSRAASGQRFVDWGDHPTVLQEVFRRAFGDPHTGFFDFLSTRYPQLAQGHALSLCSGDGGFECSLLDRGVFGRITGLELSAERIQAARQSANGHAIDFVQADINVADYGQGRYDAVFAKAALHHIENLEHAMAQIARCLRPGGLLITIDFFGPSRFQWTDAQLAACNAFWQTRVPPALRIEPDGHPTPPVSRPRVQDLITMDPSEAVRSSELYALLQAHFELEHDVALGGSLLNLLLSGDRVNRFDPEDDVHNQVLREASALEHDLMNSGVLGSDFRFIVARPRSLN
jgi:SAM-dependent methyltransferase/glycosyltransferase involved in cell wall biosynthesis